MNPNHQPPPPVGVERTESLLICLCMIIPGFVAGASMHAFQHGLEVAGFTIPRFVVWAAFVFLVIGCSTYGGWLLASRGETDKITSRFLLFTMNLLICQFILVPFLGFLAAFSVQVMLR